MPWSLLAFRKIRKKATPDYFKGKNLKASKDDLFGTKPSHSDRTPKVRQGPYGGSKETSPVSGTVTGCSVSSAMATLSTSLRETAIISDHEEYDGTGLVCLKAVSHSEGKQSTDFGVTFEECEGDLISLSRSPSRPCYAVTASDTGRCPTAVALFRVTRIHHDSIAAQSESISPGDILLSLNGQSASQFKSVSEVNEIVSQSEQRELKMQLSYHVPSLRHRWGNNRPNIKVKSVDVLLQRDDTGFGIVVRGGYNEDANKCRPIVVTFIRRNGPADLEGSIKPGDRIVTVNGYNVSHCSVPEVNELLLEHGSQAFLSLEYDCCVMESVNTVRGPLLVELTCTSYQTLGLSLVSFPAAHPRGGHVVMIDSIRPASVADRCGALHVGDQILSVCGSDVSRLPISKVISLFGTNCQPSFPTANSETPPDCKTLHSLNYTRTQEKQAPLTTIEILPARYARKRHGVMSIAAPTLTSAERSPHLASLTSRQPHSSMTMPQPRKVQDMGTPASTRSVYSFNGSLSSSNRSTSLNTSCHSSALTSNIWHRSRASRLGSISSLASNISNLSLPFLISRTEQTSVVITAKSPSTGFGFSLYSLDSFPSEPLKCYPLVDFVEPEGATEKTGLVHVGDRVMAVNDRCTLNMSLKEIDQLLKECSQSSKVTLRIQFDIAESIVPSSGCFSVKLAKSGNRIGFRLYESPNRKANEPPIVLEVVPGSMAHRTGCISAGDKLMAVNDISLRHKSVEECYALLTNTQASLVKLVLEKDDEFSDFGPNALNMYSVELRPNKGRLGITLAGSEDPFDAILIADIEPGSVADRIDVLHVNDQIVEICGRSVKGKTVTEAVAMLQNCTEASVQLKICRRFSRSQMKQTRDSDLLSENNSEPSCANSRSGTPQKMRPPHLSDRRLDPRLPEPIIVNGDLIPPERLCKDAQMNLDLEAGRPVSSSLSPNRFPLSDSGGSTPVRKSNAPLGRGSGHLNNTEDSGSSGSSEHENSCKTHIVKVALKKSAAFRDFGFSVSNGDNRPGVFINSIRPGGLAQHNGIQPLDKILQINDLKLADNVSCEQVVPIIANCGGRVDLVLERKFQNGMDSRSTRPKITSPEKTQLNSDGIEQMAIYDNSQLVQLNQAH